MRSISVNGSKCFFWSVNHKKRDRQGSPFQTISQAMGGVGESIDLSTLDQKPATCASAFVLLVRKSFLQDCRPGAADNRESHAKLDKVSNRFVEALHGSSF